MVIVQCEAHITFLSSQAPIEAMVGVHKVHTTPIALNAMMRCARVSELQLLYHHYYSYLAVHLATHGCGLYIVKLCYQLLYVSMMQNYHNL